MRETFLLLPLRRTRLAVAGTKRSLLTAALLAMGVTVAEAKPRLIDGEGVVALTGATVIDGTGAAPRRDAVVAIAKNRIVYVGDRAGVRLGRKAKTVDLAGRWLIPGFIDTHVHIPGPDDRKPFLARVAAYGTTTVRESAGAQMELRELVATGEVPGPRIVAAGLLIDGKDSVWGWAAHVETVEELRAEVRKQLEQKPDFIKLYVGLPPLLVKAAIEEAHARGVRVMGHLGKTTWGEAAELGIDSLAHSWHAGLTHSVVPAANRAEFRDFYVPNKGFRPSQFRKWRQIVDPKGPEVVRLAELLHRRHIELHPNLVLGEAVMLGDDATVRERLDPHLTGRHPYSADWSKEEMVEARRAFPVVLEIIRVLHEKGVLLTAGTDYMNPWMTLGVAYHRELELFVQAGIPPADVLRIATRNGAEGLGLLKETGTIEAGKAADLVVLTADPLASISNTRKIERVFLRGREVAGP
jgi:imidazolonepropionase-like amidohydrolase